MKFHVRVAAAVFLLAWVMLAQRTLGVGALLNKSGPIQITNDGQYVWVVNPDHDSVSRLRTSDNVVTQFALPAIGEKHKPQGLALLADGSEVWVACHDSDRVYVLSGTDGSVLQSFAMPYGSGPISVAISPTGAKALVALHRSGALAVFDTASRTLITIMEGLFRHPYGIAFVSQPNEAWLSHTIGDGEPSYLTRLDTLNNRVLARINLQPIGPQQASQITGDPNPIPEGGYFLLRSHIAQRPGSNHLWVPSQHQNLHNPTFTPDSTIQAAVHKIDLTTQQFLPTARVILTAVTAHNPNGSFIGPGWNAHIAGPADIAFDSTGATAYLVNAYSNDVLVFATSIGMNRPNGAAALPEINVGDNPIGLVASPTINKLYVLNYLSRDVSVIDLTTLAEESRIPITPGTSDPVAANILTGAKFFNSSVDPRVSANQRVSCASCHPGGEMDGLFWGFAPLGAGNRKTFHLLGQSLSFAPQMNGLGQLHRSGDRDEVQDFDFTFKSVLMGGTGFLSTPNPELGPPNAGLNPDLDALASFVLNLPALAKSPFRAADGTLTEAAKRGAAIFGASAPSSYAVGCKNCHPAPNFTDLGYHAVGGNAPPPENQGPNFNSPSLVGAFDTGPYTQTIGFPDSQTLGGVLRHARTTSVHGNTSQLNRTHMHDLEAFLNSIDGTLAQTGISGVADTDPPRVIAVKPVSASSVEVIFNETVQAASAGNLANYVFSNGQQTIQATAAAVNTTAGNRVRVTVPLAYSGCAPVTYTLLPGPIQDVAGAISGGPNNVLNVNDPVNHQSFVLDGTITVTFGDTGNETFGSVGRDASFDAGQANLSYSHVRLFPGTTPETKGFVLFDFVPTLMNQCGVTSSAAIVDARFSLMPHFLHRNTLELHRCLMPWGDPPTDFCQSCTNAVTRTYSKYATIPWHASGAAAYGGAGTSVSEYYPVGSFDVAATVDAIVPMGGMTERVELAAPQITDAFRFWFDHPVQNFGYSIEANGNSNGNGTDFWPTEAEDGQYGLVLSVTFSIISDCNNNGVADACDIANGTSQDANGDGIPDECGTPSTNIVSANPPTSSPWGAGPFRDVLQPGPGATVTQGIGGASTPSEAAITYSPIAVTFAAAPVPPPSVTNITIACTDIAGNGQADCPIATSVTGSGVGPYLITLSGAIPPRECVTLTFAGTNAGQKLQYQSLPGDVSLGGTSNTQDLLALVTALNNGTANQPANRARYNINRSTGGELVVNTQDLLRLVQLLNGTSSPAAYNGATVAACP
jgi:DNA-binding beta-propeller fold protein YncE